MTVTSILYIFLAIGFVALYSMMFIPGFPIRLKLLSRFLLNTKLSGEKPFNKWIVLAGDSNLRNVWLRINKKLQRSREVKQIITSHNGSNPKLYERRWVDRDSIFVFRNNSKLRVSLRFLHGGIHDIYRINQSWNDVRLCFDKCDVTIKPSKQKHVFTYKTNPDVLWFNHGLWGTFPINKKDCYGKSNQSQYIYSAAKYLSNIQNEVKVIWQTNPSIASHPIIKTSQVESDYVCQTKLSSKEKIKLFDIYKYTTTSNHMGNGYHYDVKTKDMIVERVLHIV